LPDAIPTSTESVIAPYWCCAQHEPGRERLACYTLGLNGYEVYCPHILTPRVVPRQKTYNATLQLFPSYLFVRVLGGQWWNARWSAGVGRVILDGGRPAVVRDAIIDEIKSREVNGFVQLAKPPTRPEFIRGDKVRIANGPFTGLDALFEGQRNCERVAVLLSLLGGERIVDMARGDIRRAETIS
jgi:transcriptional antiterminator RfaH